MRVLLSIKPEFAYKILSGEKKFEYRRRIFRQTDVTSVLVYASGPVRSVIGEFQIGQIITEAPDLVWDETYMHAGINREYFDFYFHLCDIANAIEVKSPITYDIPVKAATMPGFVAPQSFRYVSSQTAVDWNLLKTAA